MKALSRATLSPKGAEGFIIELATSHLPPTNVPSRY